MTKFFVLDFDRTLGRMVDIVRDFLDYVGQSYPAIETILREERRTIEATGGSFDMVRAVGLHIGQTALDELLDTFIMKYKGNSYLEDGASQLMEGIVAKGDRLGILTYGGEVWQDTKLRLTGLDTYQRIIVAEKGQKGRFIASWYDTDRKMYCIPEEFGGGECDAVVLIDDKLTEFAGFPHHQSAHGYVFVGGLDAETGALLRQAAVGVPSNIEVIDSLYEAMRREYQV